MALRVIDVVVEGISIVSNYRDQFKAVLSGGKGPDDLLEKMRRRTPATTRPERAAEAGAR